MRYATMQNCLFAVLFRPHAANDCPRIVFLFFCLQDGNHFPVVFAEYSNKLSRYLGNIRMDCVENAVKAAVPSQGDVFLGLVVENSAQVVPAAMAVARTFCKYSRKTTVAAESERNVHVDFFIQSKETVPYSRLQVLADAVRTCQALVDMPCAELHSDSLVKRAVDLISDLQANCSDFDISIEIIRGNDLDKRGFGGLWGVGKAASNPPALVLMTRSPAKTATASKTRRPIAFVGKGIMFDTGGLSIKSTSNMCSMKHDMGGAAAVLCAFEAIVRNSTSPTRQVHGVLCIAENAVGPNSYRNDDILKMYSGKTVEINNTDAEGRLVLADGVAYVSRELRDVATVVTIATLTGAQMVATGMKHAGVMSSTKELEDAAMAAAAATGDLAFPMLYAPELLNSEFDSQVADMKNSVKDRSNASSSAAGHFIESHLASDYKGGFLHIDIAGPSAAKDRATGYGVALLEELAKTIE